MQPNDTEILVSLRAKSIARFWKKVDQREPTECWNWKGASRKDYGLWIVAIPGQKRKSFVAHRVAYVFTHGAIPGGLVLDHLCRNPRCVNPAHLEAVTHKENCLRGVGPCAIHAAKTHCKRGHEFTPENTYVRKNGSRQCRVCVRLLWRKS